jgi:hypothetical protein
MQVKEAKQISINGAEWLRKIIQENGRFIYGYNYKTLKKIEGYNSLRHTGSLWAMLSVVEKVDFQPSPFFFSSVVKSLEYYKEKFLKKYKKKLVSVEDGWIKLGGNGLASIAFRKCYELGIRASHLNYYGGNLEWIRETADELCEYILDCRKKDGTLGWHKRKFKTGKDKGFISGFYPGEACLALAEGGYIEECVNIIKAYYKLRQKDGHIRDHWMMQAIETVARSYAVKSYSKYYRIFTTHTEYFDVPQDVQEVLTSYADEIANKNFVDKKSKKAGPTACRSECLLSYIRYLMAIGKGDKHERKILKCLELINEQLDFQAESIVKNGLSEGAFTEKPGGKIVRNDFTQHNISAFMGYYLLRR